ncbi:MAG: D-isomer specific 2-hydroxyacid dehydrogenase NAD-binding [Ramlibacter sp.]|nr:D-isomer specific 2-hydroxyacid dehydrogenase NAD-binding [Ramlibacter sp.]
MAPTVFVYRDADADVLLNLVSTQLASNGVRVLRGKLPSGERNRADYDEEASQGFFADCDVMMFGTRSYCSRKVIESAPRLVGLVNPTIGVDTVDVQAASELGIIVGHGPVPENYIGMAEANVMLILNLFYQLRAAEEVLQGKRGRPPLNRTAAQLLRGRVVGMIGFGRVARATAERLNAFGVRIAVSPRTRPAAAPPYVELVDAATVFRVSDVVCLFATADAGNREMVNTETLAMMKPTAYLVNTARGSLVDEHALYLALRDRRIAGAALDTFETEPLPEDSPLRMLDNVILTPHMVGHTRDVAAATVATAVENILRVLRGEMPIHCKNPEIASQWLARRERVAAMPRSLRRQSEALSKPISRS